LTKIAKNKAILKPYYFKYKTSQTTQTEIAQELSCSKQHISKQFREFDKAIDDVITDRRGRPVKKENPVQPALDDNTKVELEIKIFLLQTVIAFLRLIIEFWSKELGLKKSLLHKWLPGKIKLFLVETLIEYRKKGGKIQDYAEAVGKNPATLYRWLRLYEEGKSLENHQPPGRPKKIYPRWIKKRIMKLHKKYPEASNRALALRFNNINSSVMLKANDIDNILQEERLRLLENRKKDKKRFDFTISNISWDIDFIEFTLKHIRYKALVIVDHHSRRLLYARILLNPSSLKVKQIIKHLCEYYRVKPVFIKADNGPEFRKKFRNLLSSAGINLLSSPCYYPQFNGVVERLNREIRRYSRNLAIHSIDAINSFLEKFQDYYNHQPHESLGYLTPAEVFRKGWHNNHPLNIELINPYIKDGELRMSFTKRDGRPGRLSFEPLKNAG